MPIPASQFDCTWSYNMLMNGRVTNYTVGFTTFFVGAYISNVPGGSNMNPIIARFDQGSRVWCRTDYETTTASVAAIAVTGDGEDNIVVGFAVAGQTGNGDYDLRRFTGEGWVYDYGIGVSGVNVLAVLKIDDQTGQPIAGSYITAEASARSQSNWVFLNHLEFAQVENRDGSSYDLVRVKTTSYYSPRRVDGSAMMCSTPPPYDWTVEFGTDLMLQDSYSTVCE